MPPRGGFGPGGPMGGMLPRDTNMGHANQLIDWRRTTGRPPAVPGLAGTGYIPSSSFSLIDLYHRFQLAKTFSIHRPAGVSRFRAFVGNYQVLSHDMSKRARFDQMVSQLSKRRKDGDISDQKYADRIMYEAVHYYGWLKSKYVISEEQYREHVTEFAETHGIDFDFGDEAPSRTR